MRHFKRLAVALLVVAMILSTAGFAGATAPDVVGTRFEESVDYLMGLGVVAGYPDGTFKPAATITRAEAAKILVVIKYGDTTLADLLKGAAPFSDVPGTHWASGFIALAKNAGIVNGYPDGTFKPEAPVTYAEFAKMLCEAAGVAPVAGLAWPANYVSAALNAGILTNVPDFESDSPATRGDCAIMAAYTVAEVENPTTGKTLAQSVFGETAVATVEVTPATSLVAIGEAVLLGATAKDADGNVIADATATWATSAPTTSAVNATGLFVASAAGTYTVTADVEGVTKTATVTVYGVKAALKATVESATVPANGATTTTITVEVVDANGATVANDDTTEVTVTYTSTGNNGAVAPAAAPDDWAIATPYKVTDGKIVFKVVAGVVPDLMDTFQFASGTLTKATASVSTVDQVATSIKLTATVSSLTVNQVDTTTIKATVLDQAGKKMQTGVFDITFSITGKGKLAGGTADKTYTTMAQEVAGVAISSEQGDPGTFTVTASAAGLTSASATITTYIAGAPVGLTVTVGDGEGVAGGTNDMKVTVTVVDKWGQPTYPTGNVVLGFTGPDASGLTLPAGTITPASPRIENLTFHGTKAGTFAVTVKDTAATGALTSTAFECTVIAGAADADHLKLTPTISAGVPMLLPLTNPTATFSTQLRDAHNNSVAKSGVEIKFWVTKVGGTGSAKLNGSTATLAEPLVVKTDATGKASVTFTAQPYADALYTVHAQQGTGAVQVTGDNIGITDTVPGSLTIATANGATTIGWVKSDAGQVITGTITLKDTNGNTMAAAGHDIKVVFSNEGKHVNVLGGLTPTATAGEFTATTDGAGQVVFTFEGELAGTFTITASAMNTYTPVSVVKSFVTKVGDTAVTAKIFKTDGTLAEDVDYDANELLELRVCLVDNGNNVLQSPVNRTVSLVADWAPNAVYRETSTGSAVPSVVIEAGRTYKTVFYVHNAAGVDVDLMNDATLVPLP